MGTRTFPQVMRGPTQSAVVSRPGNPKGSTFVTTRGKDGAPETSSNYTDSEVSVTAQIPLSMLQAPDDAYL